MQKALARRRGARGFDDVYRSFLDEWSFEPSPVRSAARDRRSRSTSMSAGGAGHGADDVLRRGAYLPDDICARWTAPRWR